MSSDLFIELAKNPEFINNYDLIKRLGLIDHIQHMNSHIKDLEAMVSDIEELISKKTIFELVSYITGKFLNRFVPSYLTFVLEDESLQDRAEIMCFRNMTQIEPPVAIPSLEPYKFFFSLSPNSVSFSVFEYMVGRPELTDVFRPLSPQLVVPIIGIGGVTGFIVVSDKVVGEPYGAEEIDYINTIMKFASISLQNTIHYRRAIIDFKTRLHNHSYFMLRLEQELARVKRYNKSLSLLVLDVDHFKRFNDSYGHLAGDKALFDISQILMASVREADLAARFGGEEFVVLLVETGVDSALMAAERIRTTIETLQIEYNGQKLGVTVSIGVSCIDRTTLLEATSFIEQADAALYASKKSGRNRSTVYDPILHPLNKETPTDKNNPCEG